MAWWGWDASASSGGLHRGPLEEAAHPRSPLTLLSLCLDITGPIILQTYRAIADYEKSSGSEMALATGDVVDVVEKGESGQSPALPGPSFPAAWAHGHKPPPRLCPSGSLGPLPCLAHWGPDCPPTLWVIVSLSMYPGVAVGICTYCMLHCACLGVLSGWAGQLLMCVKWVLSCASVTLCVFCVCGGYVTLVWSVVKVTLLNPSVGCLWVCVQVSSLP